MTIIIFYIIGFILTYVMLRLISEKSPDWNEVMNRVGISLFSWLTLVVFGVLFLNEWITDVRWNYMYKRQQKMMGKEKKKRKPITPPKWL